MQRVNFDGVRMGARDRDFGKLISNLPIFLTEPVLSSVISITDTQFEAEVLKSEQPVLIYFWAPWCGPCRLVSPSVNWAADNYSDRLKVVKMEVDPNKESVARCKVEGVPALRLFNQQEMVFISRFSYSSFFRNKLRKLLFLVIPTFFIVF